MENNESIKILFEKYLADACSLAEVRLLLDHFNKTEEEESLRELIRQQLAAPVVQNTETDRAVDAVRDALMKKIISKKETPLPRSKPLTFQQWTRMAAIWFLLILSAGTVFYFYRNPSEMFSSTGGKDTHVQMISVSTQKGERKEVVLEDGSVIWLNAVSRLTYPEKFGKDVREVNLAGEAYFEVSHDNERPFFILSGKIRTKVLGTSFDIKAYSEDKTISVAVLTGKVQVSNSESKDPVLLIPDQRVLFDKTKGNFLKETQIQASSLITWREGKMQFRNVVLGEVITSLKRNYDTDITCNPALMNCPVYADFEAGTPVAKVLEMLSVSVGGSLANLEGSRYYLDGKGCP
ncbi:hypothetical protein DYBT9275_05938 [Dyadobacter sp. CECT 9275]|uniref:FecR family protein n=1 Tax=Dyadobacter helix TaxID=2822344 RepID=A0A916JHQ6_9BACT|nr:FecR domain-containing protein [Dyadobacter sp. CECT 9275]CAG5018138.1 hypothetical protein DYBT9275_05938 [Dyadobacter sp. CECT 9275]